MIYTHHWLLHCAAALAVAVLFSGCGAAASEVGEMVHGEATPLSSSVIARWADGFGPGGYEPGDGADVFTDETHALGEASGSNAGVVVLGKGGRITLDMGSSFSDSAGADFAVWENGISGRDGTLFAELAYVEVSSDGVTFARFSVEDRQSEPVGGFDTTFGYIDPARYSGFAGLYPVGVGTAFDLNTLKDDPAVVSGTVDLAAIRYVRIIDVIGDGCDEDASGRAIYDPYPTVNPDAVGSNTAGFDLDGVAVLR